MTKVRRTSGAAVLPLVAAAVGLGVGATPADAAICSPLSSASITGPSGTITAGSTVHASARVSGMLLTAHMQITGPGLDQQVGPSAIGGTIEGDVRVPKPGVFTLKVLGNGTGCVYDSDAFSVTARPSASKPSPHGAAGASGAPGASRASKLPRGIRDGGTTGLKVPSSRTPFRLPNVAPDGTGPSVRYPSTDPQVAAPPVKQPQPQANNAAHTVPPIKWGQSIGIALVLLLLSAHMGMWSRRQRLAETGSRRGRGSRGARRANADQQITARMPLAGDHPAVPRDAGRTAEPHDGHMPLPSGTGYTGTPRQRGRGQEDHMFPSDRPGATHPAGHANMIDWESWVGTRRQLSVADRADSRGWAGAADRDGRVGSWNQDTHVYPGGEMAGQPRPYPLDGTPQPGRVGDSDLVHSDHGDAIGWATAPPASVADGRGSGAETGRAGPVGRGGSAVSLDRATRSGRGGYRGRRRRS